MIKVVVICFCDGSTLHLKSDCDNVHDKVEEAFRNWNPEGGADIYKGMRAGMIEIDMLEKDYLAIVAKNGRD